MSAREFVSWYNGHPSHAHLTASIEKALSTSPHVIVYGLGNVALDCARIIAKVVK